MKYQFITIVILTLTLVLTSLLFSFVLSSINLAKALTSANSSSFPLLSGIISSLILDIPLSSNQIVNTNDNNSSSPLSITNIQKFILAGDWTIKLDNTDNSSSSSSTTSNLEVTDFIADFIAVSKDGKGAHTHQISNFNPIVSSEHSTTNTKKNSYSKSPNSPSPFNVLTPDGNALISGTVDVGITGQKIWDNVKTNITISDGKTIEILLHDRDVDYHFGKGQAIYGLVKRLNPG